MDIGTKIFIKDTDFGCMGCKKRVGVITHKKANHGLLDNQRGYNVELDDGIVWRINKDASVEILAKPFNKDLLKPGVVVERANHTFAIIIGDTIYSRIGHIKISDYNENIELDHVHSLDIINVYKPTGDGNISKILDGKCLELIASRPEDVKEMTLDQVCKELGYRIKIVEED